MSVRKSGRSPARSLAASRTTSAVTRPHAGIDDERRAFPDDHADVRHQRHTPVGDHEDAVCDLLGSSADDGRHRRGAHPRGRIRFGHGHLLALVVFGRLAH